jgi:Kef-type K+ transport system membrane component KefB
MKSLVMAQWARINAVRLGRTLKAARLLGGPAVLALACSPVLAQSLKQAGVNIFNVIYGVVGVIGAIACLLTLLNWVTGNWLGRDDPKKIFFQSLLGTALAFGVVAIVQFVKDMVGGSASGISNL